ncbi:MAG TPA: Spi family protease inhibitor, partial [Chitinophagales bacterium]|nr:Spi family protease inhibitor [Chitinophagales bacterium]
MKKTLTLTLTFLTIFGGAFAGNVTVETAKTVAVNFISPKVTQNQRSAVNATLQFTSTQSNGAADFYIFNISPKGFVIVSADDHVTPILAYSTENSFNQANNSSAVKVWMDHAATHIRSVAQRANVVNAAIQGLWVAYSHGPVSAGAKENKGVAPMLKTNWGQEPNYNQYCPFNTVDNQRCVTGCVATA